VLEATINGRYCWVPFAALAKVAIEAPADLRDLVWSPAQLEFVNGQASNLAAHAKAAEAKGAAITPGEMIGLTVQCHEFMFNCQLTSNIANRTSDGLQQLFRQQA